MRHLGIDPGTTTGLAVSEHGKLLVVTSMPLHRALFMVLEQHAEHGVTVWYEDARLRRWFGKMDAEQRKYGAAVREGAGAAKRDAAIWGDFLEDHKIPHVAVKPVTGATKRSAEQFRRMTGWVGQTNEHGRDAAGLVWGR